MREKVLLFDLEPTVLTSYPEWYTPSKYRKKANSNTLKGLHPMGNNLSDNLSRCGDCEFITDGLFPKCEKSKQTKGPATDIVRRWHGCSLWKSSDIKDTEKAAYATIKGHQIEYYDSMEIIDRAFFHMPARRGDNSVRPSPVRHLPPHLADEIIRVRNKKDNLLRGLPRIILDDVVKSAMEEHLSKLKPCMCNTCTGHRGVRL